MRIALAVLALALLPSCEQKTWTRDEIVDIADDSVDASDLDTRVANLESQVEELESRLDSQGRYVEAVSNLATSTSDTLSQNARAANENAVNDMTRRGACGKEWVQIEGGGAYLRNIECTQADLKK